MIKKNLAVVSLSFLSILCTEYRILALSSVTRPSEVAQAKPWRQTYECENFAVTLSEERKTK